MCASSASSWSTGPCKFKTGDHAAVIHAFASQLTGDHSISMRFQRISKQSAAASAQLRGYVGVHHHLQPKQSQVSERLLASSNAGTSTPLSSFPSEGQAGIAVWMQIPETARSAWQAFVQEDAVSKKSYDVSTTPTNNFKVSMLSDRLVVEQGTVVRLGLFAAKLTSLSAEVRLLSTKLHV